ncbi:MAG: glycosyltransferase family 4 protein [Verrucomicrobiota bacterium JB022]|nr:glycosyltransferase family 4 protein [Verrucomicrobiota bacterium JB022]
MKWVYTAPNRAHHYPYARALADAGVLGTFVSGFSRLSPRSEVELPSGRLKRVDLWQSAYVLSARLPFLSYGQREALSVQSKRALDAATSRALTEANGALFYAGTGNATCRRWKGQRVLVCEAVNSHWLHQYEILADECARLKLPAPPFHPAERDRRLRDYAEADCILGPSDFVLESFRARGVPTDRLLKVRYGAPAPVALKSEPEAADKPFRVLYVGQLNFRKGLRYLAQAFDRLRVPRKELWLVGPEAPPTGMEGAEWPTGTQLRGVLKGEELTAAYRAADVFVQPSLEEGLSLVVGEAMAHGLPVVASEHSGAAELLEAGRSGWLFPARGVDELTTHLETLAVDPELRRVMGEAAARRIAEVGGWDRAGRELVTTLARISPA